MKQETLEEAAYEYVKNFAMSVKSARQIGFRAGAKWQQERSYSEEDMIQFAKFMLFGNHEYKSYEEIFEEWFEQFKKK